MKYLTYIMAFIAFTFFVPATSISVKADEQGGQLEQPTAVMFFSENCGACKILDPRMKEALQRVDQDNIDVVVFDFSNKDAISQTRLLAKDKDLENVLQQYGARTGFVALVDGQGEVVERINVSDNIDDIVIKLNKVINT